MKKISIAFLFCLICSLNFSYGNDNSSLMMKYRPIAEKIIKAANADSSSWNRLSLLCDSFGHRLSGSKNLEDAIDWIYKEMQKDRLSNVTKEEVYVPNWKRKGENIKLVSPRHKHLKMLSLGGSCSTPDGGIKAEVYVVKNKEELFANKDKAKGKIVLFNFPFTNYGETVQYRFWGAVWGAEVGAVATLIRSVSPHCMDNPHTGMMAAYPDTLPKLPHAAITCEDADMLARFQDNGVTPIVHIKIDAEFEKDALSYNTMGELIGTDKKEEIIAIGGHIDSWDVGTGAQDDAAGCVATWNAVKLLKDLGLKPRRTIRAVMWTNEENGQAGGKQYAEKHGKEPHLLMLESDSGIFPPQSFGISGKKEEFEKLKSIESILKLVDDKIIVKEGGGGVDIAPMMALGIAGIGFDTDDKGKYFWYHHSDTDTVDKVDAKDLNNCVAAIAIAVYIYADLD